MMSADEPPWSLQDKQRVGDQPFWPGQAESSDTTSIDLTGQTESSEPVFEARDIVNVSAASLAVTKQSKGSKTTFLVMIGQTGSSVFTLLTMAGQTEISVEASLARTMRTESSEKASLNGTGH